MDRTRRQWQKCEIGLEGMGKWTVMLVASRGWKEHWKNKAVAVQILFGLWFCLFVFLINILDGGGMSDLKAQNLVCVVEVVLNGTALHSFKVI